MNTQTSISDRLEKCYSGAVYDVLRAMGYPNQALPNTIRPIDIHTKLAGSIYTVSGRYDETMDPHETLLQWTGLLSKAPKGSVVSISGGKKVVSSPSVEMLTVKGETIVFRP